MKNFRLKGEIIKGYGGDGVYVGFTVRNTYGFVYSVWFRGIEAMRAWEGFPACKDMRDGYGAENWYTTKNYASLSAHNRCERIKYHTENRSVLAEARRLFTNPNFAW